MLLLCVISHILVAVWTGSRSVRLFITNADIVVLSFTRDLCVIVHCVVKRHFAFRGTITGSIGYGHAGCTFHRRQLSPPTARAAIPELHRLRRLIDQVIHGHGVLRGVKQDVHPGWTSHPAVTCPQPCLLRREWEHGNSCPCSCIDRLCGTLLCPLQVVQ